MTAWNQLRLSRRAFAIALAASAVYAGTATAQDYPTKPIRFIVPTAAGGASDIVARTIAEKIQVSLGQPVVVEARPGANGNLGAEMVLAEPADGYTLMMGHIGVMTVNVHLYTNVKFDPQKEFTGVHKGVSYGNLLVVHPSVPANTTQELIDYAKANPGKLKYGSPGYGGSLHLGMETFKLMADVQLEHVPYQGAAPALADLMGGHIHVSFSDPLATLPQVQAGTIRALAVSGSERLAVAPEIPTVAESGIPGFDVAGWTSVVVKAGTPQAIIDKLNEHIDRALTDPGVVESLRSKGATIYSGTSPADHDAFMKAEYDRWKDVVEKANLKIAN